MVAPSRFSHVVLNTQQLKKMIGWYGTVLNAHIVLDAGSAVYMTYDNEHHRLALFDTSFGLPDSVPNVPTSEPAVFELKDGWTVPDVFAVLTGPDVGLSH